MKQSKELLAAIEATKEAAKIAVQRFGKKQKTERKQDGTLFSDVDIMCQRKVVEVLQKQFPDYGFLGEEDLNEQNAESIWVIDALDGTHNYMHSLPLFGIQVALERRGRVELGVVCQPALNRLLFAERNKGAFLNGKPIRVSKVGKLSEAMVFMELHNLPTPESSHELYRCVATKARFMRGFGAGNVGCSFIAEGCGDALVDGYAHPWDAAPSKVIIEEAGGRVTDFFGKDSHRMPTLVASNGKVHNEILELLKGFEVE